MERARNRRSQRATIALGRYPIQGLRGKVVWMQVHATKYLPPNQMGVPTDFDVRRPSDLPNQPRMQPTCRADRYGVRHRHELTPLLHNMKHHLKTEYYKLPFGGEQLNHPTFCSPNEIIPLI